MPRLLHSLKIAWLRGIHFLYRTCIEPRSSDEDSSRREFILNIILTSSILLVSLLWIFLSISAMSKGISYRGISIPAFGSIVGLFGALLFMSRKGFVATASYLLIILYFLCTTYGTAMWGILLPFISIGYVITIITSSILISTRFGFIITGSVALVMLSITGLQIYEFIPVQLYWRYEPTYLKDPLQIALLFLVIMAISWLSNREIERSLARARRSEQDLLKERDLLEIKVEERTRELKSAQQEKLDNLYRFAEFGRLSGGIFHDLMNPLTAVVANISLLESAPQRAPYVKAHLIKAVAASKRMGSLLESVRKQLSPQTLTTYFSLNQELSEALDILQYRAREASVDIRVHAKTEIKLTGNALKFHQIAINLVANAIDACEDKATANLRPVITIRLTQSKKFAHFSVTDKGCGIAPDIIPHIFDPFFTTKPSSRGMGLGLSTTKHIVEKEFGGTVKLASTQGIGTTIEIILPLHHAHTPQPEHTSMRH